jgi:hypothetical protein
MQFHVLGGFVHEAVFTGIITILGTILVWPFRKVKNAYNELHGAVKATHAELVLQRENCLGTLQRQGESQIEILGKVADTLDGVRLDLAEQTGYLRAGSPRRRAKKKT